MVQLTSRDEAMLEWLGVVRMADVEAIRWALSGLAGDHSGSPVSRRKAQQWVARLAGVGLVDRARPNFQDGQVVCLTQGSPIPVLPHPSATALRNRAGYSL